MTFERFIVLIITDWLLNFKPFAREEVLGPGAERTDCLDARASLLGVRGSWSGEERERARAL